MYHSTSPRRDAQSALLRLDRYLEAAIRVKAFPGAAVAFAAAVMVAVADWAEQGPSSREAYTPMGGGLTLAVLAALVAGTVVTGLFVQDPGLRPLALHAGLYGVAVNVVVLVLGTAVVSCLLTERLEEGAEVRPRLEVHGEVDEALVLPEGVHGHDVRMPDPPRGPGRACNGAIVMNTAVYSIPISFL